MGFERDEDSNKNSSRIMQFAKDQMQRGRTCIVAGSRHTARWKGDHQDPVVLARGDLAFLCNGSQITTELIEWAAENIEAILDAQTIFKAMSLLISWQVHQKHIT